MWSGVGQYPQARELACRENEERGVGPPQVPSHVFDIIPEEAQQKIIEAIVRALVVAERVKPAAIVHALLNIAEEKPEVGEDKDHQSRKKIQANNESETQEKNKR